jgi:ankyrin repeat protein
MNKKMTKAQKKQMFSELWEVVTLNNPQKLLSLIKEGYDINLTDSFYGRTILIEAIVKANYDLVKILCENNADINLQDKQGKAAIHYDAMYPNIDIMKLLFNCNPIIDIKDAYGNTPLSNAVFNNRNNEGAVIEFLLSRGADPDNKNNYDISPKKLAYSIANYDLKQFFE